MNILIISIFFLNICFSSSAHYGGIEPVFYCSTNNESQSVFDNDYWKDINQSQYQTNLLSSMHHVPQVPELQTMSTAQLEAYFAAHQLSEKEILEQPQLYMSDAYIALVKKYSSYPAYVRKYYEKYVKYGFAHKCWSWIKGSYKSSMAQRFIDLYREQVRAEHAKKLIQEYQAQKAVYHEQLQKIEHGLLAKNVQVPYTDARVKALQATVVNGQRIERRMSVAEDVQHFAKEYEIEQSMLERGFMNPYEYQLHTEFIDQLNIAVQLQSMPNRCREHQVFLDAVGYGVSLGLEANHNHEAAIATHWADYGWKALDLIKAFGEGVALGCYNLAMIPVQVASGAMYCATHLTETLKTLDYFFSCAYNVDMAKAGMDWLERRGDQVDLEFEFENALEYIDDTIAYCTEQLEKIPLREKVKYLTAFGTEIVLPTKFFKAGKILCTRIRPLVRTALRVIQDEQIAVEVAGAAGENLLMKVSEGINEVGTPIQSVIPESVTALGLFYADFMKKLEPEIATLRSLFDNKIKGFGEFANKYLKIDYEHILGMDLFFDSQGFPKLSGFHHDFMNAIEKENIIKITNKIMGKAGFYKADIIVGDKLFRNKTFFSAAWPREKIINKIHEAYQEFIMSGRPFIPQKNGTYKVIGVIKEGVEIEICITKKGRINTAYPLM